jgi:intracellular multiplication protein IcmB
MSILDKIAAVFLRALRQPIESFVRLETADDETTFVAKDGSLMTVVAVHGSNQIIGDSEYRSIIERATLKLGSRFDRPGQAWQVYYARNPDDTAAELKRLIRPVRLTARAIGLDVEDLLDERERHLENYISSEKSFFVLWTRPSVMTKAAVADEKKRAKEKKWVNASEAQYPLAAMDTMRARHKSYVGGFTNVMDELQIRTSVVEVHEAMRQMRASLFPGRQHSQFQPSLPGDPISPRAPTTEADMSEILWPTLGAQLAIGEAEVLSPTLVRIDNLVWGAMDLTLAPMDPMPFPQLLGRMQEADLPFRISYLIESGGIQGASFRKMVASILAFTSDTNKQIKRSLDGLVDYARNKPVVRMRVSLATWAPADNVALLEQRVSMLMQAVESWGLCQVTQTSGDPLDAVMSSALGIACASTAPAAVAPLQEVIKILPWQRACSPFESGPVLLRTADGKVWPYETGSALSTLWFDLIYAQPGAGKSVLLNALNLGTCLKPGLSTLPFVSIIDIGPSSSGLIAMLRDALPPERRHEAAHYKLRMTPEYAVNPFDTQLGCRFPLTDERSYLVELLTLISTPAGQTVPYDGMGQLAGMVVDEMFRWRADKIANSEPRPYITRIDTQVDEAVLEHRIEVGVDTTWWDIVDGLFEANDIHHAQLAQRYAVPTLTDAAIAARRPQIRALLDETSIGSSAEGVIHAFERMIASAIREFPILSSITKFDISGARVCALDLQDVSPQGDEAADRQTALMYMLARHTLVRSWWMGEDALKSMPRKYIPYHTKRVQDIRETAKRICFDEFHRTSRSSAVRNQVIRDVREGRKWGVQIALSSQLLDDFSQDMVDLATGVWILGAALSERAVNFSVERFGLSDTAKWVMRNRLTGPRASGAPALFILGTNEGRYEQFLINTLGPIELWALSTSSEDVIIRNRLYQRIGGSKARRVLARAYPRGSARAELRRRITMRTEAGEIENAALSTVTDEMVEELMRLAEERPALPGPRGGRMTQAAE